jgi:heme/copper-type cytochrome/quinol oxidase subunit 2
VDLIRARHGSAPSWDYDLVLYLAAVVFVVVSGLQIWSMIRYRRRSNELINQAHGSRALELIWTVIPMVIVLFLIVGIIQALNKATESSAQSALTVDATAFQWSQRFAYQNTSVTASGRVNQFDLTSDKVGLYHGQCTLFCGLAHTDMGLPVLVVSDDEHRRGPGTAAQPDVSGRPGR